MSKNERADIHVWGQEVLPGVVGLAGAGGVRGGGDDDLPKQAGEQQEEVLLNIKCMDRRSWRRRLFLTFHDNSSLVF